MTAHEKDGPILVPVDFSGYSEAALLCAADLADTIGARLAVLHVVHDPGEAPGYYAVKGHKKQLRRMEDVAGEMMDQFISAAAKKCSKPGVIEKAETLLVSGLPVNRILETAKKIDARMIVMGSQGRTGLKHLMLGSKAEQVVNLAPIPVTIVKANKGK
ncbi:MAG: universal stress protein [Gammaproteobacteria bacterium]|jgi:nucleotide-binding universal stress UspA family protein